MARYHCSVVGWRPPKTDGVRLNRRTVRSGPSTTSRNSPQTMTVHVDFARFPHTLVHDMPRSSAGGGGGGGGGAGAAGGTAGDLRGLGGAGVATAPVLGGIRPSP